MAALTDGIKAMSFGLDLKCGPQDNVLNSQSPPHGTIILVIIFIYSLGISEICIFEHIYLPPILLVALPTWPLPKFMSLLQLSETNGAAHIVCISVGP